MRTGITLSLIAFCLVAILGVIFTKRKSRLGLTVSQHIGSNRLIAIIFGIVCVTAGVLISTQIIFSLSTMTLRLSEAIFAVCLIGIGVFPHLPDDKQLSSRVHVQFAHAMFLLMMIICAFIVAKGLQGSADLAVFLLSSASLLANIIFGLLFITQKKKLRPKILIWESVCILLFLPVLWLVI